MPRKIRKKTLRKRRRKTYGSGLMGNAVGLLKSAKKRTGYSWDYLKSAISGTRVKKLNENQINNHRIPFFLSLMKYYLYFMWGKDAIPIKEEGKGLFPIPFPGQIFRIRKPRAGDGRYVCVQSCIGSLNPTERVAGGPPGVNSVQNMVINGSISLKSIPPNKIKSFEKLLKEYKPDTETDYRDNKHFVKMFQKLYDLIDAEGYDKEYDSGEKIIWGIPLIKLKYVKNEEEFKVDKEKYIEYGIDSYEKYKEKYKESREIVAFNMGEIDIYDAELEQYIKDRLEKEMNYEKEDSMRRRYGILDLKDSNKIEVQLDKGLNKIKTLAKKGKQTREEDEEKPPEDKKKTPNDAPPMSSPTLEGNGDDSSDLKNEGKDSEEKVEGSFDQKDTPENVELITSTIKKYLKCPTLEDPNKDAFKDCKIDSNGYLSKYVSKFLEQVLNVKRTDEDEDLDKLIKNKIDEGLIYIHMGKILIKEKYTVTIRKPDDNRLNAQTSAANLPKKLYYLKNNNWLTKERTFKKDDEWDTDSFDELKNDGRYKENIQILSTILLVKPNSSTNKVAYISWKDIDIERIKGDNIENVPWLSITRKISGNSVKKHTFIGTINGESSVWIGGGVVSSIKRMRRKWKRSDMKDNRLLKRVFGREKRERLYSSIIDQHTLNKNWTYKIGDIFLWLGNSHLYVKRNPEKVSFETYRQNTMFDTNTFHRVPKEGSYCIVVGYGVDILYTSEENENNKENIEKIKEYGNNYKHNFLLNQKDSTEKPKYLLEDYDDEISSRFIYGKKEKKYRWAKYDKEDYLDEKTGGTPHNEEEISHYQNREKTPNKRCYYIVESTKDIQDKAKLCKVYVDEVNIWGVNSNRFTRAFRLNGYFGRDTGSSIVDTTQGYIEKEYKKYYSSYTLSLTGQKGGKPDKTKKKSPDSSETDCESNNILAIDSWSYKSEPEVTLDKMKFLRTLPCSLYNYFACIFMIMNEKDDEEKEDKEKEKKEKEKEDKEKEKEDKEKEKEKKTKEKEKEDEEKEKKEKEEKEKKEKEKKEKDDENKLKQMIKLFEECNNDKKIYYRYPMDVSYYEDYNTFYFKRKYIKPYLKDKKNYISSKFTDLESFSLSDEEEKDNFESLFKSLVNPDEWYSITETPSKDVIEDTREIGTTEKMFKLYPEIKKIADEGDFLQNYMNQLKGPLDISNIKSFSKYGIELDKWINENKKFSMPFIATNRKNYMGFPAFVNILKDSYSKEHKVKIYSFGYYMYKILGSGQTLEWIDKHMSLEDYNKHLENLNISSKISDTRLIEYNRKIKEKTDRKQNEEERVVHAPLIIICENDDYYIPPLCFNINPYTEAYINQEYPGVTVTRFKKNNNDIIEYCHDFLDAWKKGTLLIIDNIDLTETYSENTNRSNNPIYNLNVYGEEKFYQYNSKRKILPVNNERSMMCQADGLSDSIKSIIKMTQNTYGDTQSMIGFTDVKATITNEPFAKIFDSNVREFKSIDINNNFLYYDFWHFSNILERLEDFAKVNQGALAAKVKTVALITQKITDLQDIHRFGKYDGINMFFIDDNGSAFFKYLFIKYKNDIKIFDEPPVYSEPLVSISGGYYNTLFYRWNRPELNKIPLIINKNAVKRIDSVMEKSGSLTEFYGREKVPKSIDPTTPIHSMFQVVAEKVENITTLAKDKGWADEAAANFNDFLITLATTRNNLDAARNAVRLDAKDDVVPVAPIEGGGRLQGGGGLRKRTTKKYKKNIDKTLKKNIRLKRTNKKIRRTSKKIRRTGKKIRRTGKKKAYNP